tara:strand:+ start:319 stop:1155 length:837 start_codon:yes stop_codon:yes gene_type:complete
MKIIECPRDAMQGLDNFIPTDIKIKYINQLLKVGFDTIDFGSFVSPKSIPQLRDTAEVINGLDISNSSTKLLTIIANFRGAIDACNFQEINYLGYPLSISEEFQKRNTNKSIDQALNTIDKIKNLSLKHDKQLVVYLSMAFGNPYGEKYHPDLVVELTDKLNDMHISIVSLSDTIGAANTSDISHIFKNLFIEYNNIELGAHFHSKPDAWKEKIEAAYNTGCRRFDSAIKGFGGCPMAQDKLVGNIPTEKLVDYFSKHINLNKEELSKCTQFSDKIFV